VELRHLRYFVAVAETGSFRQSAQRLRIAQPALSTQIKKLEAEISLRLFVRESRGVRLTPDGRSFLSEALQVLAAADRALKFAHDQASGQTGLVRVGLLSTVASASVASRMRSFTASHPDIRLQIRSGDGRSITRWLHARELDVAFTRHLDLGPDLAALALEKHEQMLAVPADHEWYTRRTIPWRLLHGVKVLLIDPKFNPEYGRVFLQACARHSVAPEIEYAAADLQLLIWLVLANFGVCPYPSSLAFLAPKGLALRRFAPSCAQLNFVLAWLPNEATQAVKAFVQHFRKHADQ
jgi:LysR family transcriptional regulator, hca operon transcriptional activator